MLQALGEDHSDERVGKAIAEVDLNANGKISFEEFVKFVQLVRTGDSKAVRCGLPAACVFAHSVVLLDRAVFTGQEGRKEGRKGANACTDR